MNAVSSPQENLSWRAEIFRRVGTLRCAQMLQIAGARTATDQMLLLIHFVIETIGGLCGPSVLHGRDVESWAAEQLAKRVRSWQHQPSDFDDWHILFERS